jgi:hypothetical protein
MAGSLIGALRVTLGIETSAFEAGAKRARETAGTSASAITKSFSHMSTAINGLLAGLSVGAIVTAAAKALDYASSLDEVSQQLGVTSKDLQEYRYAATQVGISQEEMDKGLARLTVTMGQARAGVEKPKAAFKELSDLLGKDVLKSAATAGDAIPLISDALAKVQDPAARAALEVALFGKTGQKLDTLLAGGSDAVNQLRDAARDLGLVLSDEQIQNADKTADKLSEVKQVLEANLASVVSDNASAIFELANALEAVAVGAANVVKNIGLRRNLRGLMLGGDEGAAMALTKTKEGRVAAINALNQKLNDNNLARASGTGDAAALDKQFKSLNHLRNAFVHADTAADRLAARQTPKTGGAGAGTSDAEKKAAAAKAKAAAEKAAREAEKATRQGQKQTERYNSEMAGLERDRLGDESDLTTDIAARADLERKRVQNDADAYKTELDSKVALGELLPVQAHRLEAAKTYNTQLELDAINQKRDDDLTKQALSTKDAGLTLQSDLLNGELSEAKTQADRRKLQMQLLDIEYDRQKAALQSVLQLNSSTQAEKDIATARLAQLDALKGHEAAGIHDSTMGPMEAFGDSLHRTAGQISEDFQQIQVDGIKSLNDGLIDAIVNSKSLGDVFSSVAKQIIGDLLKISLQAAESSLFGGKSSGTGGGLIGGLLGAIGLGGHTLGGSSISNSLFKGLSQGNGIKGLAGGGTITVPNRSGIDTNLLSINGMPTARVNSGEAISVTPANDRGRGDGGTRYYDFRGVQSADIPRLEAMITKLDRSIEPRSVSAVADASDRRVIRR